jgi:hypothetical protein
MSAATVFEFKPILAKAYLADFQGSHVAAADYAGVGIPVIKRAIHGEYLDEELKRRLYSAAIKRMGKPKVETILGFITQPALPTPLMPPVIVALPEPVAEVEPEQECLRCRERHPFTAEFFSRARQEPLILRRVCRSCWKAAGSVNGKLAWKGSEEAVQMQRNGHRKQEEEEILSASQQLLSLAAFVEQLERRELTREEDARALKDLTEKCNQLQSENAQLKAELASLELLRTNLAALLGPRA